MIGNKAKNLIKMKESGINIPDFTVLSFDDIYNNNFDAADIDRNYKGLFAVRSSASAEDSSEYSFAGQFRTFLNVKRDEIPEKIQNCLDSIRSKSMIEYAQKNGIDISNVRMNVIVQRMVQADFSGVIFTSNPQGILNETVINVAHGLGENVVSEKTASTTYYYSTTDKLYYYEGSEDILNQDIITNLIKISEKIKDIFGEFLDIEFAVENGKIFILQCRKITTLNGDSPLILDNSNIVESYPGISLPLTISFVHLVYSGVFRGVCSRIVKNKKVLDQRKDVYNNMVGDSNGRLYYKISNWYTVLKFLPFSKKIIPIWQEMLGVKTKNYSDDDDITVPPLVRIFSYLNFACELIKTPHSMKFLEKEFRKVNDEFYSTINNNLTTNELHEIFENIRTKLFGIWDVTLINDMYAFIFTGLLKSRLKKFGRTDDQINEYLSGISEIESMKPMKMLVDIAFHKSDFSNDEYEQKKAEYISLYGDRMIEELKLESKTFRSDPALFDEKIDFYTEDSQKLKSLYESLSEHGKNAVVKEDAITAYLRKKSAIGIKNREISRLNRSRIYGIVRMIFATIGRNLENSGEIDTADDIFYLTIDEVFDIPQNAKNLISERKQQYSIYRRLPAYTRLIFEKTEFNKSHGNVNTFHRKTNKNKLIGTPCSFGEAEGRACVVTDPKNISDVRGKILVTKMTDPGWVFLLAAAEGVISEKGSLLSHTAIISRELKIPSVVGVEGLLDSVNDGDFLHLNGSTGEIEILRENF